LRSRSHVTDMASDYGLVNVIQPPRITDLGQPALITFETEYAKYIRKIKDINESRADADKIKAAPVRDCMDADDLHGLCIMGEIEGASSVEEVTVDQVQKWFDDAIGKTTRALSFRIKTALSSVKYKQKPEDPSGAVLMFCLEFIKALDTQNCSDILKDAKKAEKVLDMLQEKIEPIHLRKKIRNERALWSENERGSISHFKKQLTEQAIRMQEAEDAIDAVKSSKKRDRDSTRGSSSDNPIKKKKRGDEGESSSGKDTPTPTQPKGWTKDCLNPKCNEKHPLKHCQNTSPDEKKILYDKFYENRKKNKASKVVSSYTDGSDLPDAEEGRYRIFIEDNVVAVALGDYGADFSAISEDIAAKVQSSDTKVAFKKFDKPMQLECAFKTESRVKFTASRSVVLSITIVLPGSNIPVRIRGIEFIVVDQPMDEVLLGRPFLKAIGFDLNRHLEEVRDKVHDRDINKLQDNIAKMRAMSYQGLAYQSTDDDPIELPEAISAGIGKDTKESIDSAFAKMLAAAKDNGISPEGHSRLSAMLENHRDIFRIKLGPDQPAKVEPLRITLMEGATPYRSPQRRYAPQQRDFITRTIRELEDVKAIYKNPKARWASPALAVTKPGSDKLRFTVDLRGPNARTVPITSAMPHLESHLQDIEGSTCFANADLAHSYWQVPLSKESQEMMSIQTPIGVYSSKRLLQGGTDSGNHFQAVLQEKFDGRVKDFLQWIDDFLFYAKNEKELLDNLEAFFRVCLEVGIKIHAEKCNFFTKEATFCGRIITAQGVQYHPRNFDALVSMNKPTKADELQQLLCATNWMRNSIPAYATVIAPLHHLMESAYKKAGKRTKLAVRKISIDNEWGAEHDSAFNLIKTQLAASVKLAHPKPDHSMCLFTDASDTHWSAILTQVPNEQCRQEIEDQAHEPLCFLSGAFKGRTMNWSTPEKEGFAIVEAMCRLDYLVTGHTVSIFTDHANLVYMYDPYGRNPGMSRQTATKLMRWAIKLSAFRYIVEHLPGERNVWADMLTRWAVQPRTSVNAKRVAAIKSLILAPVNPSLDKTLDWPSLADIKASQKKSKEKPPRRFQESNGIIQYKDVIWIPSNDNSMKIRILVAAHTGLGGHRGPDVTAAAVRAHFMWKNMYEEVKSFVHSCLHCLCTSSGAVVPRPLGRALHALKPNQILHFDFCYMSPAEDDLKYVLVLKDDHSGYVMLRATKTTDAETAATHLIEWFAQFGVVTQWISDRGTHFKNELVRLLSERYKANHHFTLAYCPWSNGTVEVVNRELLRASRALLSEFQLPQRCWPNVLPMVQSALNNAKVQRLGNRCPQTVFTSRSQDSPLTSITRTHGGTTKVHSMEEVRALQNIDTDRVQASLDNMHRDVAEKSEKKRKSATDSYNRKVGVRAVNFAEGDFVLRGVLQRERGRKPSLRWKGPFRVLECRSEYIFLIENLLTSKKEEAHGRRLKFYRNKDYEVTEELKDHLSYQQNELLLIERFDDIRRNKGDIELQVKWRGFSEDEQDWVSLSTLREDVPVLVEEYLSDIKDNGTQRQRRLATTL